MSLKKLDIFQKYILIQIYEQQIKLTHDNKNLNNINNIPKNLLIKMYEDVIKKFNSPNYSEPENSDNEYYNDLSFDSYVFKNGNDCSKWPIWNGDSDYDSDSY